MPVKIAQRSPSKPATTRRSTSDVFLLFGAGLLVAVVGVTVVALSEGYKIPEFWVWGTWMGAICFIPVAQTFRSKLGNRPSKLFLSLWFVVHMVVTLLAAAYLRLIPSIVAVAFELWMGGAVAFWLYRYRALSIDKK